MCSCNYLLRKLTSIFRPDGEYFQVFPKLFIKKCCERIQYSLFYKIWHIITLSDIFIVKSI